MRMTLRGRNGPTGINQSNNSIACLALIMTTSKLIPIKQTLVPFYDDELIALTIANGDVMIPIRPLCELLGVDPRSQQRRIQRDPVLHDVCKPCEVVTASQGQPAQRREMTCVPLEFLNGWLFGIAASRVKPELQEKIVRYQRECYRVLSESFQQQKVISVNDELFQELLATDSPAAQAYKMVMAMAQMAKQQVMHEAAIATNRQSIDANSNRISLIEAQLGDKERFIDGKQASRISQAVKAIGLELGKRSGRNEFGGVYGELYRRFEIAGYRELPAARYDEAFNFLSDWFSSLTNSDLPF